MGGDAGIEVGRATPGVVGAAFEEVVWFLVCSAELADVTAAELVNEAAGVAVEFMDHETVEL
jgi:hypothetical protein